MAILAVLLYQLGQVNKSWSVIVSAPGYSIIFSLTSFVLSLLLVFRTNSASVGALVVQHGRHEFASDAADTVLIPLTTIINPFARQLWPLAGGAHELWRHSKLRAQYAAPGHDLAVTRGRGKTCLCCRCSWRQWRSRTASSCIMQAHCSP